ncbi:MAG TPA: ion channel [Steroidobacteraceae bacterium]|nr:ion channel [Steroidobacteraceae bacterium]
MRPRGPRKVRLMLGTRQFTKIGVRPGIWRDAYHLILGMGWLGFLSILVVSYTIVNLLFAVGFWLSPGAVANTPRGYLDLLFFSIETLSTVGYGTMYPVTIFGHVLASLEIFVGLLILALTTGLVFARFSRPTARIQFSNVMVIAPFNAVPTLMMRAANERHNLILEATVNMTMIYQKRTLEGEIFRHQHDLALVRHRSAAFTLSWTVMHKITESSPLYGKSTKDLEDAQMIIAVSISGMDDTLEQLVHARTQYDADQILFDRRFVDIIAVDTDHTIVDLTRLNETQPVAKQARITDTSSADQAR